MLKNSRYINLCIQGEKAYDPEEFAFPQIHVHIYSAYLATPVASCSAIKRRQPASSNFSSAQYFSFMKKTTRQKPKTVAGNIVVQRKDR